MTRPRPDAAIEHPCEHDCAPWSDGTSSEGWWRESDAEDARR